MSLQDELAKLEAEAARLRREIAAGPCRDHGHDWKFYGGRNAGCGPDCGCSIPVYICSKCGDCDYGDNDEANQKRADCEELSPQPPEAP